MREHALGNQTGGGDSLLADSQTLLYYTGTMAPYPNQSIGRWKTDMFSSFALLNMFRINEKPLIGTSGKRRRSLCTPLHAFSQTVRDLFPKNKELYFFFRFSFLEGHPLLHLCVSARKCGIGWVKSALLKGRQRIMFHGFWRFQGQHAHTILGIIPCNECQYYKRGKIIS